LHPVARPLAALVLGHGAGGGVAALDLLAARDAALALRVAVVLVEQPYRVAGRGHAPAHQLDAAWSAVIAELRTETLRGLPLIPGGRSAGARVACRTAAALDAVAVLCLAFPLHPPGRGGDPAKSRLGELDALRVPTLVVEGERDPFGMPPDGPRRVVVRVPGNHALRSTAAVKAAVSGWLGARVAEHRPAPKRGSRRARA
jgi:predicted alpha/beta-hydrolase family hydrolase